MKSKILLGLLVLLTHGLFSHRAGWNQNARLDGVFAFVEPGTPSSRTLRIDDLIPLGGARRTGTGDWAKAGSHYYSNKPPGSTMLGILVYLPIQALEDRLGVRWSSAWWTRVNGYLINLFVSVFFSALGVVFLFEILTALRGMSAADALLVCAAYGWGTLIFSFDATLWGHPTAAAFVMIGLHGLLRGGRAGALQAGLAFGLAVLVDYVAGVALGVSGLYCSSSADRRRTLGWYVVGATLPLAALLMYQRLIFGSFLTTATFRQNPLFQVTDRLGGAFGGITPSIVLMLLFSTYRGAFLFMPVLLVCLFGASERWRVERSFTCYCLLAILGTLLLISSFNGWHGGSSAGPRYLIPALPFFALLMPAFSRLGRFGRWLFAGLLVLSIANALVVCATTTIVPEDDGNPLYGSAYGRAWRDRWSLAPPCGERAGTRQFTVALVGGISLSLVVLLVRRTRGPQRYFQEAGSKHTARPQNPLSGHGGSS